MKIQKPRTAPELYAVRNVIVVDGDTIKGEIVLPLGVTKWQIIRLKGWWAPEPKGASEREGVEARARLERFLNDKNVFILVIGSRFDRYGRLIASLWHGEGIVAPERVLGPYQLTKDAHKGILDAGKGIVGKEDWPETRDVLAPGGQSSTPAKPESAENYWPKDGEFFGSW